MTVVESGSKIGEYVPEHESNFRDLSVVEPFLEVNILNIENVGLALKTGVGGFRYELSLRGDQDPQVLPQVVSMTELRECAI